jgi:hypothetical protein
MEPYAAKRVSQCTAAADRRKQQATHRLRGRDQHVDVRGRRGQAREGDVKKEGGACANAAARRGKQPRGVLQLRQLVVEALRALRGAARGHGGAAQRRSRGLDLRRIAAAASDAAARSRTHAANAHLAVLGLRAHCQVRYERLHFRAASGAGANKLRVSCRAASLRMGLAHT